MKLATERSYTKNAPALVLVPSQGASHHTDSLAIVKIRIKFFPLNLPLKTRHCFLYFLHNR